VDEAALAHELVADAGARGMEDDPLFAGEALYLGVLGEVLRGGVLDVVVEGEDRLPRVCDPGRADGAELGQHGAGVVVGHHVRGAHRD